jgi:hypothetical protein
MALLNTGDSDIQSNPEQKICLFAETQSCRYNKYIIESRDRDIGDLSS